MPLKDALPYSKIIDYLFNANIDIESIKKISHLYPIFLSSRIKGMEGTREYIAEKFKKYGFPVLGWETGESFGTSQKNPPRDVYLDFLSKSKIYIGILDKNYGEIIVDNISGTEDEYNHALKWEKDLGLFVSNSEADLKDKQLIKLATTWEEKHTVSSFDTISDLDKKIEKFIWSVLIKYSANWIMVGDVIFQHSYQMSGNDILIDVETTASDVFRYFKDLNNGTPMNFLDLTDGEITPSIFKKLSFTKDVPQAWHLKIELEKGPRILRIPWSVWKDQHELKLTEVGDFMDLTYENGQMARISGEPRIPQKLRTILSTIKGEWFLDRNLGSNLFQILDKYYETPILAEKLIEIDVIETLFYPEKQNDGKVYPIFTTLDRIKKLTVRNLKRRSFELDFELILSDKSETVKTSIKINFTNIP